jgi:hypothetical protein
MLGLVSKSREDHTTAHKRHRTGVVEGAGVGSSQSREAAPNTAYVMAQLRTCDMG